MCLSVLWLPLNWSCRVPYVGTVNSSGLTLMWTLVDLVLLL